MPGYLEKTMNGDQTESNRTSCRSRSKVVSKMDPTRSLELAVMDYKKDANDKNWSNIEKVLQVNCLQQVSIQVNTSINIAPSEVQIPAYTIHLYFRLFQRHRTPN